MTNKRDYAIDRLMYEYSRMLEQQLRTNEFDAVKELSGHQVKVSYLVNDDDEIVFRFIDERQPGDDNGIFIGYDLNDFISDTELEMNKTIEALMLTMEMMRINVVDYGLDFLRGIRNQIADEPS